MKGQLERDIKWPSTISPQLRQEGQVSFQVAAAANIYDAPAFFNPIMVLNRDLTVLWTRTLSKEWGRAVRVIEPLAGIGVRAYRMAKEIRGYVAELLINDLSEISTAIAVANLTALGIDDTVIVFRREARSLLGELAEERRRYHVIDLDPFGPPTPFLDHIWPVLTFNALAAITATDMQALCGVFPKACLRKYGSWPLNNHHTHETAARILLATISFSAARSERGIAPVFTIAVDHYVKVFVMVSSGRGAGTASVEQIGYSYTCDKCQQIYYVAGLKSPAPTCCGTLQIAGPLWTGPLADPEWVQKALVEMDQMETEGFPLPSSKRLHKYLLEALHGWDLPGYYSLTELSKLLHISQSPLAKITEAIEAKGYRCVPTRFTKQAIRSDISGKELLEILQRLHE